ncbi:MAG: CBS domain-containing protein [Halobacteriales archaeon]
MQARDIMNRDVESVAPDDEVSAVLRKLAGVDYSGFPVVDDDGIVVGIITEHDLVGLFEPQDRTLWIPIGFPPFLESMTYGIDISWDELDIGVDLLRTASKPIESVMSSPAVTVSPETEFDEILELLADEDRDINRLPVVEDDVLLGIIARQDVLRALTKQN